MARFTVNHPTNPQLRAEVGHDHAIGFFVDIIGPGADRNAYSSIEADYDDARPLLGALRFLASEGFYSLDDLHEALAQAEHEDVDELPEHLHRIVEIVWKLKEAADG